MIGTDTTCTTCGRAMRHFLGNPSICYDCVQEQTQDHAYRAMQQRYQQTAGDRFSARELTHLGFVRWLHTTGRVPS